MASATLREGIAFGYKFLPTRLPYLRLDFHVDGHQAVVSVLYAADLGIVRNHAFEFFLVGVYRLLLQCSFVLIHAPSFQLFFAYPHPTFYSSSPQLLPPFLFFHPSSPLLFPSPLLPFSFPLSSSLPFSPFLFPPLFF